jgi:hypothetical protein
MAFRGIAYELPFAIGDEAKSQTVVDVCSVRRSALRMAKEE